ncbi:MAG: serine/threonine-protein kinase [Mycobacterium sp.]
MPLARGATFAGYTVLGLLESDEMGEVYLVRHPRLPRRAALRIFPPRLSADPDFRDRFDREADLAATLWHPSIVGVHDRGEFEGDLWIAMDYAEGTNAERLLEDRYPSGMPPPAVCTIVTAVAGALDYAHQQGVLHGDVRPANILLADQEDGVRRILLTGFGIAWLRGDTVGTRAYSAPEQMMGSEIDDRADQYALAASAFHLLTGTPPDGATPPKLADRRPDLALLDDVLSIALADDPEDRFDRCRQFASALREGVAELGTHHEAAHEGKRDAGPPGRSAPKGRHGARRNRILLAAATALVALIVIGYIIVDMTSAATTHNQRPTASGPVLDGTYRMDFDRTKRTKNGAPDPSTDTSSAWWAFRSSCGGTGCIAAGTKLDDHTTHSAGAPADTDNLHFVRGHWQSGPDARQVPRQHCLGTDGKVASGAETVTSTMSLEPQPDGTLRGVQTETVLTNECAGQGTVSQTPVVLTRSGAVPQGVTVTDPATVTGAPASGAPTPSVAGPTLDGTYRLDYDVANQTANGAPTTGGGAETHWWAFRSQCTTAGCVATGAGLKGTNHNDANGVARVLRFADGHWQDTPYLQPPVRCAGTSTRGSDTSALSLSLVPQPDGTLRGVATETVLTDDCGNQGTVFRTPVVGTRTGDVPPGVVLADPTLF